MNSDNLSQEILDYLENPCRTLSIPYWKYKSIRVPDNIEIIHIDNFCNQYEKYQRYFRIYHKLINTQDVCNRVRLIDIEHDKDQLIKMINHCYKHENILIDESDINRWMNNPTYNKSLWVKIVKNNKIIASGIAEYDSKLKEGIIEWVQVLPEYRNKGYGKDIVNYLLKQLRNLDAGFVTVSGSLDNKTKPEKLYRKCGFIGDDIWYICQKVK